ncbi:hypothetical protein [Natronomonas marina]|jgi:hypothetical protein|uniref:hypothetical protein n=1 Tax=Natronomonas marina TaxID=2961939 RepID=UPI0020C94D7D|nr:hypothetical protein [Natronomonas marina]
MALSRRRLLALAAAAGSGCIEDAGRDCPGSTYRLRLRPAATVTDPLPLDAGDLSTAANAVVETAIDGEHVETCVAWDGSPGPSAGLREVGERVEAHADVSLAGRREDVRLDAVRGESGYRLELEIET